MNRVLQVIAFLCLVFTGAGASCGDNEKPREIRGWGTVVDPDRDCTFVEDKGKLTVKVPGSLHDLYPEQTDPKKRYNAPRVLREVKGDFVATVKVTADWKPGDKLAGAITVPYNGAGLLIWVSDTQFIRLERNLWVRSGRTFSYTGPLYYTEGREANNPNINSSECFKGRSTWLRVARVGENLTTSISHDGKEWIETGVLTAKFPETLRVGVEAINSSDKEFAVDFEEFKVEDKK